MLPGINDYIDALHISEESFRSLKYLRPEKGSLSEFYFSSGNYAVVFKMTDSRDGSLKALKCFTRNQERRHESLLKISEYLDRIKSPYIIPYRYFDNELWVNDSLGNGADQPVLLMDWVEGLTLGEYIRQCCERNDRTALESLETEFAKFGRWLLEQEWAHGDLKHDNIIVKPDGGLVLVDYDGCFVPSMKSELAREMGSPCFRHPKRCEKDFDRHIDDFSILVILLSIKALSDEPAWHKKYFNGENIVLGASDLADIKSSEIIRVCRSNKKNDIRAATALLEYSLAMDSGQVLGLVPLLDGNNKADKIVQSKQRSSAPDTGGQIIRTEIIRTRPSTLKPGSTIVLFKYKQIPDGEFVQSSIPLDVLAEYQRTNPELGIFENAKFEEKDGKWVIVSGILKRVFEIAWIDGVLSNYYSQVTDVASRIGVPDELIPYRKGDLWGYCDNKKRIVIPCTYKDAYEFKEDLACVKLNDKYGYIDLYGRKVTPFNYDEANNLEEGMGRVKLNEKWGFIDRNGKDIIPCKYDYAMDFSSGMAFVKVNGKCGWIDRSGRETIPIKYDDPGGVGAFYGFSEGLAKVTLNLKDGCIDRNGKEIIPFKYNQIWHFQEGMAVVRTGNFDWGYIDKDGKEMILPKYDEVGNFSEGLAPVKVDGQIGFIDKNGKEIISPKYHDVTSIDFYSFKEGLAGVWLYGRCGFIDREGKEVIPIKYDQAFDFKEGLASVTGVSSLFKSGINPVENSDEGGLICL